MGSGGPRSGDGGLDPRPEPTDVELLQAFRAGDVRVFSVLYERHRPAALRYARSLTAGDFAANDAVSDAFLRVYSAMAKGDGPADAFRAYLFTAIRSAVVDDVRRTSRLSYTDDLEPYADRDEPVDAAAVQEDREFISRAFAALTDQWKQVLWLTSVEGRRHNEVAEILGLKANAVAALALRAREGLRQNYLTAHLSTTNTRTECRRTVKNLAALVRAKISPREKAHAEDHLRECRRCRVAAVMLTDLNRVMPAVAVPALLAPAPWLVRLHGTTAGIGSTASSAASAAPGPTGTPGPTGAPGPTGVTGPTGSAAAKPAGRGARVTSFAGSHSVALVAGTVVAVAAVGAVTVAATLTGHATPRAAVVAPLATSPSPSPTPPPSPVPTTGPASTTPPASTRASSGTAHASPRPAPPHPSPATFAPSTAEERIADAVLQSLNASRAAHGLAPLAWFTPLERAATAHTDAMIATHAFAHQVAGEPDFAGRLRQQGVSCTAAAENIAATSDRTTAGAVAEEQRMADERPPGTTVHADNILYPPFTEVGIAIGVDDARGLLLITEDLCRP